MLDRPQIRTGRYSNGLAKWPSPPGCQKCALYIASLYHLLFTNSLQILQEYSLAYVLLISQGRQILRIPWQMLFSSPFILLPQNAKKAHYLSPSHSSNYIGWLQTAIEHYIWIISFIFLLLASPSYSGMYPIQVPILVSSVWIYRVQGEFWGALYTIL